MNIKLTDFAMRFGISDRHARRLLTDNKTALAGHYVRNTKGTWIDEYAADVLRNSLRNPMEILPPPVVVDVESERTSWEAKAHEFEGQVKLLKEQLKELGATTVPAKLLEAADAKTKALEDENAKLNRENGALSAQNALLSDESAKKDKSLEDERKTSQKLSDELEAANKKIEQMKNASFWQRLKGFKE